MNLDLCASTSSGIQHQPWFRVFCFKGWFYFYICEYSACVCLCAPRAWLVSMGVRRGHRMPWNCSYRQLPYGCWELNLAPLEEQTVLLTSGLSPYSVVILTRARELGTVFRFEKRRGRFNTQSIRIHTLSSRDGKTHIHSQECDRKAVTGHISQSRRAWEMCAHVASGQALACSKYFSDSGLSS